MYFMYTMMLFQTIYTLTFPEVKQSKASIFIHSNINFCIVVYTIYILNF